MIARRLRLLWLAVAVVAIGCSRHPAGGEPAQAAIAMPDVYSADVAEHVLRAGGNAVDAAVAAAFTLAVTYPEAGNIGGGGFMLVYQAEAGKAAFVDYRETAPARSYPTMYLDEHGEPVAGASTVGHLATGIPGTVAGLWAAHERYGSKPWQDLVAPAAALARDGFVVPELLAGRERQVEKLYASKTNFARYFAGLETGAVFKQPELAATLERIASQGADDFYRGETARLLAEEMHRGGGLIAREDLGGYRVAWRTPLAARWRGYTVLSAPPPSSGGFALVQLLKMKDFAGAAFEGVPQNSAQYVHLVAEMEKRVFADRAKYLGDPAFVDVPIDALLADDYLQRRATQMNPTAISALDGVQPGLEPHETIHFSIVDRFGNAVANTYTLNTQFGSGVVVEGAGFLLNNEMDDFSVKPGTPNVYGVVGGTANEVAPGKRMLSSMAPTVLVENGNAAIVVGTPGGPTIFTTIFQTIVDVVDFGMTPRDAVSAPRFHHQLLPIDLVTYSPAVPLPAATVDALIERGYRVQPHGFELGDVQMIVRHGAALEAAADPRGRGTARIIDFAR